MFGVRLPELAITETLPEIWRDLGYAKTSGMGGLEPLSWLEIDAFARVTGQDLSGVEGQCLMDMSRAYVASISDTRPLSIEPMERANG